MVLKMMRFELKKIFCKPVNRAAFLLLILLLVVISMLAVNRVSYVDENGNSFSGLHGAKQLREVKKQWEGYITEERLAEALRKNTAVNASSQARSEDIHEQDKAYAKTQGFSALIDMICSGFSDFRDYDPLKANHVKPEDLKGFYEKRISRLKVWLDSGEEEFSQAQRNYLITQYESLNTPFYYTYMDGWTAFLQNLPTFLLVIALMMGFFVSGIFSDEFQLKADSIFFSTKLGRGRAVLAKIKAGLLLVTLLYFGFVLAHTLIVLSILGFDGASCPLQLDMWESAHNITIFQAYLLMVFGGYIGALFASILAMLVSAKSRITILAVIVPFVLLCFFPFLSRIITLPHVCSLFPDRLFDIYNTIKDFVLFDIGGSAISVESILIPLYLAASILLLPVLYITYKRVQLK